MNYKFHVGDYVETDGGFVGWVSYVDENDKSCICITDKCGTMSGPWHPLDSESHFIRIGAYDFTKKEKKKIEQLDYIVTETGTIYQLSAIKNKINELVDAVNELRDKENNE